MKNGWKKEPFENCIEKVTYTTKILRKDFLAKGPYPIISQEEDFINGYWDNEGDLFSVKGPVVVFGDHTRVLKYLDFDFVLGADGVKILQPRDFLLPKFFYYQLQAATLDSLGYARHYKLLKELKIAYPSRPEQQRIVGILDEAFEGIATAKANAEKNLQNARAIFESHLDSVVTHPGEGWVHTTIGDQVTLQRGFDITKHHQKEGTIPVVSSGGIKSFHSTAMTQGPGVVMGRKGTLGKVFYLENAFWPHDTTLWVKDFKGNIPRFVYYFFTLLDVRHLDSGTANPALNRNQVHPIEIDWPPIALQKKIAARLDSLQEETQRLESIYVRKLAALEALKKSLLHQAFTGELTTSEPLQERVA
jgi:type I restriction enzyme S subunit